MRQMGRRIGLYFYLFCSLSVASMPVFQNLSPKSFFASQEEQKKSNFQQILSQLEQLKKQTARGKEPEGLKAKIEALAQSMPANREEYLLGRKMFAWWLFYFDWFHLYNEDLSEAFLSLRNKQFEEKYFSSFPEEILNFGLEIKPIWSKERMKEIVALARKNKDKRTITIWKQVLSSRTTIEKWLMSKGVVTKSLHLVHGLSAEEIKKAIDSEEKITVELYPESKGGFKYVIQVKMALNKKNYSFALDGYHLPGAADNMEREINTLNLLYGPRVPVVGEVSSTNKLWLEEFIFGKHPIDFVKYYAFLKDEQGKNRFNSQEVALIWKDIQLRAATQFLLLFLKDFAMTTSILDPHERNIKLTWKESQEKQIDLEELKIFDIGVLDKNTQLKTSIVDVGTVDTMYQEVWSYFNFIYLYYYEILPREIKRQVPDVSFSDLTKIEFLNLFLKAQEFTEDDRAFFVSSIMKYLKEKTVIQHPTNEMKKFYLDLENSLIILAQEQIKENGSVKELQQKWNYVLSLAIETNSPKLFDRVNELLKNLVQNAASFQTRQLANDIYRERTGEDVVPPLVEDAPSLELETAI